MLGHLRFQLVHRRAHLMRPGEGCAQHVFDRGRRIVHRHLVDDADRAPGADGYVAAIIGQAAGNNMQKGGLARAVRP